MKAIKLFSGILLCSAMVIGCSKNKDSDTTTPTPKDPVWESGSTSSAVTEFLRQKSPSINATTVRGDTVVSVTNDSIKVDIPAGAFTLQNGTPYTGNVVVKMQTIRGTADMIFSGVTTTTNGEMLLSDGMFKLEAYDNSGNPLKLKTGMTVNANFNFDSFNASDKVFKGKAVSGTSNTVVWDEWVNTQAKRGPGTGTIVFGIDSLFTFCNLDRYMNQTPLTDITVYLPSGFTNTNSDCYIKYTGENSCAYIPSNATLKAFSTTGLHYKVVQSRAAKVLSFAKRDGKFYYDISTISALSANQVLLVVVMQETTEAGLQAIIEAF